MSVRRKSVMPPSEAIAKQQRTFHLAEGAEWGGFINIKLSEEQKEAFHAWHAGAGNEPALILDELLGAGMKVTLAYDRENECYICSYTGKLATFSSERFVTTTRAGTMSEVIALAVYKHAYIARGVYDDFMYTSKKAPNWG